MRNKLPIIILFQSIVFSQLSFTTHNIYDSNSYSNIAIAIDFDRDGDMDIIRGGPSGLIFLANDGSQSFTANTFYGYQRTDTVYPLAVADLDHDGDYDVISGIDDQDKLLYHRNDGLPTTFESGDVHGGGGSNTDAIQDIKLADMDSDGDLDIVTANYNQGLSIFKQGSITSWTMDGF